MNCLEWSLDFWAANRSYRLFYNSNHVIAVEADGIELIGNRGLGYLPVEFYGLRYFTGAFELTGHFLSLMTEYLDAHKIPLTDTK